MDIGALVEWLGNREVTSVLCEGGPRVAASLLEEGLVDKMIMYMAPKVTGGEAAPGPVGGTGAGLMSRAAGFRFDSVCGSGEDLKITAYPE